MRSSHNERPLERINRQGNLEGIKHRIAGADTERIRKDVEDVHSVMGIANSPVERQSFTGCRQLIIDEIDDGDREKAKLLSIDSSGSKGEFRAIRAVCSEQGVSEKRMGSHNPY
jgi:hypothetical protein